jgi:hypothetical protein
LPRGAGGGPDIGAFEQQQLGYAFWAGYVFPRGAARAGDLDDHDGDGAPNWQEFYCGTDPRDATSRPRFTLAMLAGQLAIDSSRSRLAAPGQVVAQWSSDLHGWQDGGLVETTESPLEPGRVLVRRLLAPPPGGRAFFRLRWVP